MGLILVERSFCQGFGPGSISDIARWSAVEGTIMATMHFGTLKNAKQQDMQVLVGHEGRTLSVPSLRIGDLTAFG